MCRDNALTKIGNALNRYRGQMYKATGNRFRQEAITKEHSSELYNIVKRDLDKNI
jgi:hypothetical protein